jgi:hypothetical protein
LTLLMVPRQPSPVNNIVYITISAHIVTSGSIVELRNTHLALSCPNTI